MRFARIAWLPALLLLAACSPQPAAEASSAAETAPAAHPVSGLEVIPLTVTSGARDHRFRVELADTDEAQRRGLMFRTELGDNEGMLFPSDPPEVRSFWMKNTPLPLDIIFIGADGRILNIHANTTPYSTQSYASEGLASGVLELRGGRATELGIEPGDKVEWRK
ncbi:MAG: DUF192 domain-containing protein [Qipengyuania sp.]